MRNVLVELRQTLLCEVYFLHSIKPNDAHESICPRLLGEEFMPRKFRLLLCCQGLFAFALGSSPASKPYIWLMKRAFAFVPCLLSHPQYSIINAHIYTGLDFYNMDVTKETAAAIEPSGLAIPLFPTKNSTICPRTSLLVCGTAVAHWLNPRQVIDP